MPDEKIINRRRKINARATALKSIGKSDDQVLDAILLFDDLPESTRSTIKKAKAGGQSAKALQDLISKTGEGIATPTTNKDDFKVEGALGGVSRFLGIEKAGRRIGSELAKLDPQHRANLAQLSEEEAKTIGTGGVNNKEFTGSLAETGLNLAGGAIIKGGARALGYAGKAGGLFRPVAGAAARPLNTVQKGKRVLGTIAKGAGIGYASDVASSMTDDESFGEVVAPGLGTVLGGAIGAAPLVRNIARGRGALGGKEEKDFKKVVDVIAPKITGKAGDRILGSGNVKVEDAGWLKRAGVDFSSDPEAVRIAQSVQDVVSPGKSLSHNLEAVKGEIANVAEKKVKPFLSDNPVPFNFEDLRTRLELIQPSGGLKADVAAFENYGRVREEVLEDVANFLRKSGKVENQTDLNDLWNARKVIDQRIENELGATTFDSPQYAGVKAAATDLRRGLNKFISDSLSNPGQAEELNRFYEFLNVAASRGMRITDEADALRLLRKQLGVKDVPQDVARGAFFRYQLDQMSNMYEAVSNIAPKVKSELGKNKLDMLFGSPTLRTLTTAGALGGGAYAGTRVLSGGGDSE